MSRAGRCLAILAACALVATVASCRGDEKGTASADKEEAVSPRSAQTAAPADPSGGGGFLERLFSKKGLPEGWPEEIPTVPGSRIAKAGPDSSGRGLIVVQETSRRADEVSGFYNEKLTAAGYKVESEITMPEISILKLRKGDEAVVIHARSKEGKTLVEIAVSGAG